MTDLLSIACSRIMVASIAKRSDILVPRSKLIILCLIKLLDLGYISAFKIISNATILVTLKFVNNKSVIRRLVRLSTPGKRTYFKYRRLHSLPSIRVQGFLLVSTSYGVMTEQECFFRRIGGEALMLVV